MADKDDNQIVTGSHDKKIMYIFGAIVVIIIFFVGMSASNWHNNNLSKRGFGFGNQSMMGRRMSSNHFSRSGGTITSSSDRISGTVTAVNGTTLSVAGHGSSYQVLTTSSTQYQNGSTAKVNDTVVALGTTNNGVLTATEVVINPFKLY